MQELNRVSLRTIWGLAKSDELKLNDEELHLLVFSLTKKDSLKKLTDRQMRLVISHLLELKDSARKEMRGKNHPATNGNEATQNQRKKIYKLCDELGWEKEERVNGMCKRMFRVDSVKWLNYRQCSDLIEALKKMLKRKEETEKTENGR